MTTAKRAPAGSAAQLMKDDVFLDSLDSATEGDDFRGLDYAVLVFLGVVLPAVLLLWGWM